MSDRPFRVVVAGTRTFSDRRLLDEKLILLLAGKLPGVEIVSGGAPGADALGEEWAFRHCLPVKRFDVDWQTHGRAAGPIRNREMAGYADALVLFWDGKSRGSADMLRAAGELGLETRVVRYQKHKS